MIDVSQPVENPALVQAMEALRASPSPETERAFFDLLQQANFLLLVVQGLDEGDVERVDNGVVTLKVGATFSLPMLCDKQGRPLMFVFTDWYALRAFQNHPDQKTLVVPFSDWPFYALREGAGCVGCLINPGTHDFFVPRELIASLNGQAVPYTVPKDTPVQIGIPAQYPQALADAVRARMQAMDGVHRAWLLLMTREGKQGFLMVVDFEGERRETFDALGGAAMPHLPPGMYVDFVPFSEPFGQKAARDFESFYEKRGLLG